MGGQNPKPKNCMVRSCKALANCCCLHLEGERVGGLVGGHPATAGPQPLDTTRLPPPLLPPTSARMQQYLENFAYLLAHKEVSLRLLCGLGGVSICIKAPKNIQNPLQTSLANNYLVSDTGSTNFLVPLELGKTGHFKIFIASKGLVIPNGSYFWALLASRLYTNFKKVVIFF